MPVIEDAKRLFERATGVARPKAAQRGGLVRSVRPRTYFFADDGMTPNNPILPLVIYPRAVALPTSADPAAVFEDLFASHGWEDSWRDGIYDFLHFHTQTHEVLGIARGAARVQFGGKRGEIVALKPGDVIVLPAGTGHQRLARSADLLVVGAYPASGHYDEPQPAEIDHAKAVASIAKTRLPAMDPVYGRLGPLTKLWRSERRR